MRTVSIFTILCLIQNTKVYIPFESSLLSLHDRIKINLLYVISKKRDDVELTLTFFIFCSLTFAMSEIIFIIIVFET